MRAKSVGFLIVGFCALLISGAVRAEVIVGQPAPALIAMTLDGKKTDLSALKDKIVVVHFWATWCVPCREEMPALEAVWRQYHGKGMEVLAVSVDRPRSRGDVDQVMHYFSFPAAMFDELTKNDFGTPSAIPVTYVIDKQGVVKNILTPNVMPITEQGLGDIVKMLIDTKTDAKPDIKPDDRK